MSKYAYQDPVEFKVDLESLIDEGNPRSLVNLVPQWIGQRLKSIPGDVSSLTLKELEAKSHPEDRLLRLNLWIEHDRAMRLNLSSLNLSNIYSGVCYLDSFKRAVNNSYRLLYIVTPPANYQARTFDLLDKAYESLDEILTLPIIGDDGKPNDKIAAVKVKIFELTANRVMGGSLVRSMQMNVNRNINETRSGGDFAPPIDVSALGVETLRQRIKELEAQKNGLALGESNSPAIEVMDDQEESGAREAIEVGQSAYIEKSRVEGSNRGRPRRSRET